METQAARTMALKLMEAHSLQGWSFGWLSSRRKFGICNYRRKQISLSIPLVEANSEERVRDTVLHEIAHALVGFSHGHNYVWKAAAVRIGAPPQACWTSANTVRPSAKYIGTCRNGHTTLRNARSRTIACKKCCNEYNQGKWSAEFVFTYRTNTDGISK